MQFPILSIIVFTPIISGLLILLIPGDRKAEIRVAALAAASIRANPFCMAIFLIQLGDRWLSIYRKLPLAARAGNFIYRRSERDEYTTRAFDRSGDVYRSLDLLGD